MPDIASIETATQDGVKGFIIEWEFIGFSKGMAKFRAVGMTALRFPTTITEAKVVGVREFGDNDFNVRVFVPTEGFPKAGIPNPVKRLREDFGDRFKG